MTQFSSGRWFFAARLLSIACLVSFQAPGLAAPAPPTIESQPGSVLNQQEARRIIEKFIALARLPEVYADARKELNDVTLPLLREATEGAITGAPAPDAKTAAHIAKLMTFLDYVRIATNELDGPLADNRDAMISDAADLLAKHAQGSELKDFSELLNQPVVVKSFDAFYALSKLVTGFSLEDSRSFAEFSAWAKGLSFDFNNLGAFADGSTPAPSPKKVQKAKLIVEDLFKVTQLEETAADVKRFMKEVYLQSAPLSAQEKSDLSQKVDQYDFAFAFQKSMVVAIAPAMLATSLSDEQLQVLHGFVRSPAFDKLFTMMRAPIKIATSLTKEEISSTSSFMDALEHKSEATNPSEQDRMEEEWRALYDKWFETLKAKLTPQTREGLSKSYQDLTQMGNPI